MAMEITPETSCILNIPKIMDSFQHNINKITSIEETAIAQSVYSVGMSRRGFTSQVTSNAECTQAFCAYKM